MPKTLRIFSLNIEYGRYSASLIPYIASIRDDFDVFCLQEVPRDARDTRCFEEGYDADFFAKVSQALPEFTPYYAELVRESFGIATLVRSNLKQKFIGEEYLFGFTDEPFLDKNRWNHPVKYLSIKVEGIRIVNLHGAWQPKTKKRDTPERIRQSKILQKHTKWHEGNTMLIGDFNLNPDTKSIAMLEKKYTNLISQFDVKCTRTAAYHDANQPYADYAFVWERLMVKDFRVHLEPIFSDHGFMTVTVSREE